MRDIRFGAIRIAGIVVIAISGFACVTGASAAGTGEERWAVGLHSGFTSHGLSVKYRMSEKMTVQGLLGALGTVNHYGARGLYKLREGTGWEGYGFGGVGVWQWGGSALYGSESVVGVSAGVGAEWDIRTQGADLPPIFLSAEIGFGIASFDNYDFAAFGLGLGIHYRF